MTTLADMPALIEKRKKIVFLNLLRIRQPVTAVVSIGHRLSGVLIFLALPFLIHALDLSLRNTKGFLYVQAWLNSTTIKLLLLVLAWSLAHHVLAGVRFLLLDIHVGVQKGGARVSAWAVNLLSLLLTLMFAGWLL